MRNLVLALAAVAGAAQAASPVPDAEFAVRWTEHAYVARHAALADATEAFAAASAALCESPSQAALDQARARWTDAMLAWRKMDGAPGAPTVLARTGRMIEFRPARVKDVEARIARGEGPDPVNVAVRGLGTAEYLLWGDAAPAAQLAALRAPVRCAYLAGVAARVAEDVHAADEGWRQQLAKMGGEVEFPRRNLLAEHIGFMLGGLDGAARRIPQVRDARPKAWPDWRSASTRAAIGAQLEGFATAWFGTAERPDASLSAFVRRYDRGEADAAVRAALDRARAAVAALPASSAQTGFGPAHAEVLEALGALRRRVEEVALAFGLVLGFNDNDGD